MTPEIHRAALRAAAKLALSAVVIGCGGGAPGTENASGATSADTSADGQESDSCRVTSYCGDNYPDETEHQCCEDEVANATFPKGRHLSGQPDMRVDALTRACCTVLAKDADKAQTFSWPERTQCCDAIGWNAAGTCTPWGPPVPPEMPLLAA